MIVTDECPSRSATALMAAPDSSHATAAECRRMCTPTFSMPVGGRGDLDHPQQVARVDGSAHLGVNTRP